MIKMVGTDMTKARLSRSTSRAATGRRTSMWSSSTTASRANELITYEALGLCEEGKGGEVRGRRRPRPTVGQVVVNPSGGLISKGHPLGATGLAQCAELNWQIRGQADKRQVEGAKVALQHNLGLGGAAVVAMYRKGDVG